MKCPIPGCNHEYSFGIVGWYQHVAHIANHPQFHPQMLKADKRASAFRTDYPDFFSAPKKASRPSMAAVSKSTTPPAIEAALREVLKETAREMLAPHIAALLQS